MLTINSTNYNYPKYQLSFKAGVNYEQIQQELKAIGNKIMLEEQEVIQTKMTKTQPLNNIIMFFRFMFKNKTEKTKHNFKNKYGKFNLTDLGLKQYLSIVSELSKATAEIQRLEYHYQNSQDLKDLSASRANAATCMSKLKLLKSMGKIDTNDNFDLHSFKSEYGKFVLTNKGLVQYLSIVSELSKATAEIQRLECHYQNSQDLKDLSANRAIAEKCKNELSLLLNINELPENV